MAEPQTLIVAGAQKSCSTSLALLLGRHPEIEMSPGEVVAFEDPHYPDQLPRVHTHVDACLAQGVVPALKRPEIMHCPEASPRAAAHLPHPLCVVVLREPVSRTLSAYHHYLSYGLIPPVHPDLGLTEILREAHETATVAVRQQIVRYSDYVTALRRLREQFGDRLLVFYQEDILGDTVRCTTRILRSLDLPPRDLGPLPRANRGNYSLYAAKPSRIAGRIGYDVDQQLGRFTLTTNPLRRGVAQAFSGLDRLYRSRPQPPELSPDVRQKLRDVLLDDVGTLTEMVGQPPPDNWMAPA
jgi:hypothetical protein